LPEFPIDEAGGADGVRRFRVTVPEESCCFEGHFPGRPVLPGIAHLAIVARAIALCEQGDAALYGVRSVRLRSTVRPGDRLELDIRSSAEDGTARFELRRGTETVSSGTVLIAMGGVRGSS
jgi:3-hydroxymyristoyl/3-hydroxydecanoyl-(acyl carrier protein) dehydratase